MLRITIEEDNGTTNFRLEGKLKGDWVGEFERCWLYARSSCHDCACRVDLNSVSFVDESGKQLLRRMAGQGVMFDARSPMMSAFVEHIRSLSAKEVLRASATE